MDYKILMNDKVHAPDISINKRPHVPIETRTIGEIFRIIENGEAVNKPDADFPSMQETIKRKKTKKKDAPEPII